MQQQATGGIPFRVVRDPVYGYVQIPEALYPIVDTAPVQRLRRISQTSLTSSVYPGATGSRFEHALGTMYLAGRAWDSAWNNASQRVRAAFEAALRDEVSELQVSDQFEDEVRWAVMAVGLLHDVGHPPFSHALEPIYDRYLDFILGDDSPVDPAEARLLDSLVNRDPGLQFHEAAGEYILHRWIVPALQDSHEALGPMRAALLGAIYRADPYGDNPTSTAHSVVSGELDVDRLDYLMRDNQRAGTEFGAIDWERLVDAFQLGQDNAQRFRILPTLRAQSAVESLLLQRVQAYRWVILHHRVVGTNLALGEALDALLSLSAGSEMRWPLGNLNYLSPGAEAVSRGWGLSMEEAKRQLGRTIDSEKLASIPDLQEVLASGVDDSSVVRGLLDSRTVASLVLTEEPPQDTRETLKRLVDFTDAAFFRKKNFISVWKTEREWQTAAQEVWSDQRVRDAAIDYFAEILDRDDGIEQTRFYDLSVEGKVNILLSFCLTDDTQVDSLRSRLTQATATDRHLVEAREGRWLIHKGAFKALAAKKHKRGALWDQEAPGTPVPLTETSSLVGTLEEADERRPHVSLYLFLPDADQGHGRMREVRRHVVTLIPKVLKQHILEHLN